MNVQKLKELLNDKYFFSDLWFDKSLSAIIEEYNLNNSAYHRDDRNYLINEPKTEHDINTFCLIISSKSWELKDSAFRLFIPEYHLEFFISSLKNDNDIITFYLDIEHE